MDHLKMGIEMLKPKVTAQQWCCTPFIPILGRQRPISGCETSLVYKLSFRKAKTNLSRKTKTKMKTQTKNFQEQKPKGTSLPQPHLP